ncbi:MAG: virulence factor SrfC family protein, partial [Pseudomonadota bacterium]
GPLKECVLRGKVAYLFDRYVAEQEITSMLLCIPDSNMEVADLPVLIGDWIDHTHGDTPAARAEAACLLFFILTKFDKHLIDSAGSSDDAQTRFERRMQASLLEKFAPMEDSWPKRWTTTRAFDNCFWLRNPNFPAEAVIDYENGRELAFRESKIDRLNELRDGCTTASLVREHFREPEAAWDNAMALNDGGVSYLIGNLRPICKQEIKTAQVAAQLAEVAGRLTRTLSRFHVSDDFSERLEAQRAAAQALNMELLTVFQHGHFGALLDAMTVSPDRLADRLRRPPKNVRFVSSGAAAKPASQGVQPVVPGAVAMPAGVILPGMPAAAPAAPAPPVAATKPAEDGIRTMTRSAWQAEAAFDLWVETARTLANADDLFARYAITPEAATGMVNELVGAGRRLGLIDRITGDLAARDYLERSDKGAIAAAMVAAEHLNAFSAESGANIVMADERPTVVIAEGESRKPFAARAQTDGIADMPAAQPAMMVDYLTDWMHMIHWFYEENARDAAGASKNPEENARLGAILTQLAPGAPA